ncbi:MAG: hypothetical protein ABR961_10165 [Thermoanaerobaculaceae bacterium]
MGDTNLARTVPAIVIGGLVILAVTIGQPGLFVGVRRRGEEPSRILCDTSQAPNLEYARQAGQIRVRSRTLMNSPGQVLVEVHTANRCGRDLEPLEAWFEAAGYRYDNLIQAVEGTEPEAI